MNLEWGSQGGPENSERAQMGGVQKEAEAGLGGWSVSPALRRGLKPGLHDESLSQKAGEAQLERWRGVVIKNMGCSVRRPIV